MGVQKIKIEEFLSMAAAHPVLDVRSPGEYEHAHIPVAYSLPLFSNEERKVVGTAYKQQSREQAIKIGLDYFGVRMRAMVEETERLVEANSKHTKKKDKIVLVHCWRGGMRSAGVAWLLDLYGFKVYTLVGGYKSFRHWVLDHFTKQYPLRLIGGYTGSGKTHLLHELQRQGQVIIDLEHIASHKGSAFGDLGEKPQPSQEQFENILGLQLEAATVQLKEHKDDDPGIWLEDESQRIGSVNIPKPFWNAMREAPVYFFDIPFEERLNNITEEYGKFEKQKLINGIIRIQKRLGGLDTKNAVNHLLDDNVKDGFRILLKYYDKAYEKSLHKREGLDKLLHQVTSSTTDATINASLLLADNIVK